MTAVNSEPEFRGLDDSVSNCLGEGGGARPNLNAGKVQRLEMVIIRFQNISTTESDRYGYTYTLP
jgi:hypothetical protein